MTMSEDTSQGATEFWIGPKGIQSPAPEELEYAWLNDSELLSELTKIPNKMAFKIGEAADLVGVKQYVLRYWETEFEVLRPKKSHHNQRMYTRRDVEIAMMIKKLLYVDRFSIEGARKALVQLKAQVKKDKPIQALADKYQQTAQSTNQRVLELVSDIQRLQNLFI